MTNMQKEILETIPKVNHHYCTATATAVSPEDLFGFLEKHFNEFHEYTNLKALTAFVHNCLSKFSNAENKLQSDIGILLLQFLEQHKDDENDLQIVVQIAFQILNSCESISEHTLHVGKEVFIKLPQLLPTIKNQKLVLSIITCLQRYMAMFPNNRNEITQNLWSTLYERLNDNSTPTPTELEILLQFFDDFHEIKPTLHDELRVVGIIQNLLKSPEKGQRKYGYFLIKKIIKYFILNYNNSTSIYLTTKYYQPVEEMWMSYITLLEVLEEDSIHLIVPFLKNLEDLIKSNVFLNEWLNILYIRILTHDNEELIHWALEFFLGTFTSIELSGDVLKYVFKASNTTKLYNYEGLMVTQELFPKFLKGGELPLIFDLLANIEWSSIPLYIWIKALYTNEEELSKTDITYELILKISSRIYKLNSILHRECVAIVNKLFHKMIMEMSMKEYVNYVKTLYCANSIYYDDFETFYSKKPYLLENSEIDKKPYLLENSEIDFMFQQKFYQLFVDGFSETVGDMSDFIKFLNEIPQKYHGWLRFVPFIYYELWSDDSETILSTLYKIDMQTLESSKLSELMNKCENSLMENFTDLPTDDEKEKIIEQCHLAGIAIYIHQKETLDFEDDETLKIILKSKIFDCVNVRIKLSECLKNTNKIFPTWIIEEFFNNITGDKVAQNFLQYLNKNYENAVKDNYFEKFLLKYSEFVTEDFYQLTNPLKLANQESLFFGELEDKVDKEDNDNCEDGKKDKDCDEIAIYNSKIERIYCYTQLDVLSWDTKLNLNIIWLDALQKHCDEKYIIFLLNYHQELTQKNPLYELNSKDHQKLLKIAIGINHVRERNLYTPKIFDEMWNILLNENHQLNICYIYEYIIGTYDNRNDIMLEKLKAAHALKSSQQISIISVVFRYCMLRNLNNNIKEEIVSHVLALTLCTNYETQIFAQTTLLIMLKQANFAHISWRQQFLNSYTKVSQTKITEQLNDIRLNMPRPEFSDIFNEIVLYVTNVPYIAHLYDSAYFSCSPKLFIENNIQEPLKGQIIKCREHFLKISTKTSNFKNNQTYANKNELTEYVALKSSHLIYYPPKEEKTSDLIVIASLIEDKVYLNSFIRSCNGLKLKKLIIDSTNYGEKVDFKNQYNLNITDIKCADLEKYMLQKQLFEDYKIVATESCSSNAGEDFTNFMFPKKCILILGHEKYGIPVTLLRLLDYTLVMPEYALKLSLDVRDKAVIFIWKYCEQHLLQ